MTPLLTHLPAPPPPSDLEGRIFARIQRLRLRRVRARFAALCACAALSASALPFALRFVAEELSGSGFAQYASLLSADGGVLAVAWKELAWSLLESLPFFGMTVGLAALLALLWSVARAVPYARPAFTRSTQIPV